MLRGSQPATLETLTIAPWPRAVIPGIAACESRIGARTSRSSIASSSSMLLATKGLRRLPPALLTSRSTGLGSVALSRASTWALGPVGQVGRDDLDVDLPALAQDDADALEALAVPRDEDQVVSLLGEALGEGVADARRGTGDEGGRHGATLSLPSRARAPEVPQRLESPPTYLPPPTRRSLLAERDVVHRDPPYEWGTTSRRTGRPRGARTAEAAAAGSADGDGVVGHGDEHRVVRGGDDCRPGPRGLDQRPGEPLGVGLVVLGRRLVEQDSDGAATSARATATRCRSPPESAATSRWRSRGQAERVEPARRRAARRGRARAPAPGRQVVVDVQRLDEVRGLRGVRHVRAPDGGEPVAVEPVQRGSRRRSPSRRPAGRARRARAAASTCPTPNARARP